MYFRRATCIEHDYTMDMYIVTKWGDIGNRFLINNSNIISLPGSCVAAYGCFCIKILDIWIQVVMGFLNPSHLLRRLINCRLSRILNNQNLEFQSAKSQYDNQLQSFSSEARGNLQPTHVAPAVRPQNGMRATHQVANDVPCADGRHHQEASCMQTLFGLGICGSRFFNFNSKQTLPPIITPLDIYTAFKQTCFEPSAKPNIRRSGAWT